MLEVTEPQVWTLIGVFATALFGMLTLMSTMFVRLMNAKFETVDVRFGILEAKIDHLDRDVQAIARRVFPERE
ncbi:MAG: hypothetical protein ACRDOT_06705 [Aeromicrobium sp.]